jgi:hypothetical protein
MEGFVRQFPIVHAYSATIYLHCSALLQKRTILKTPRPRNNNPSRVSPARIPSSSRIQPFPPASYQKHHRGQVGKLQQRGSREEFGEAEFWAGLLVVTSSLRFLACFLFSKVRKREAILSGSYSDGPGRRSGRSLLWRAWLGVVNRDLGGPFGLCGVDLWHDCCGMGNLCR